MKTLKIAVLKGDGIGPEIVDSALEVLDSLASFVSFTSLTYRSFPIKLFGYRVNNVVWVPILPFMVPTSFLKFFPFSP